MREDPLNLTREREVISKCSQTKWWALIRMTTHPIGRRESCGESVLKRGQSNVCSLTSGVTIAP